MTTERSQSILIIAGEVSGDMHAAKLVRALKARHPDLHIWGVGGDLLEAEGVEVLYHVRDMAALGLTEVLKRYGFFRRVFNELLGLAKERQPDLVLLVDYPGFNLRFARRAHAMGIRVAYYICPQVWAWKKGRIDKIAAWVDRLMVIFPFEVELFRGKPVQVDFVGHPLVEECRKALDAPIEELPWQGEPRVALLPGSRVQEIERILPVMLESAGDVLASHPDASFLLAAPTEQIARLAEEKLSRHPARTKVEIVTGQTREVLRQARAALVASGTATLETALMGCPMVIVYITAGLTYAVGRRVIEIEHIGMINVLAKREVCPEFIQEQATADNIVQALLPLLSDSKEHTQMLADMREATKPLDSGASGDKASKILTGELEQP